MRAFLLSLFAASTFFLSLAQAQSVDFTSSTTLLNDAYVMGGIASVSGGFISGEMAASTLGPITTLSRLENLQILAYGSLGTGPVQLNIYGENGNPIPGTLIFNSHFELTGSENNLNVLNLGMENIQLLPGEYRFAIQFEYDGLPSIGKDSDGSLPNRNWVYTGGQWYSAESIGIQGDWIIRAEISAVPVPGTFWLLGSGLVCVLGIVSKRK